jgi:hypothetical protein
MVIEPMDPGDLERNVDGGEDSSSARKNAVTVRNERVAVPLEECAAGARPEIVASRVHWRVAAEEIRIVGCIVWLTCTVVNIRN